MKYVLWIAQILLAIAFGAIGFGKLTQPIADVAAMAGPWVNEAPELLVRFIGLAEVLGAIGMILPALTRIQPRLTPLAATGFVIIMILAIIFHATRGEYGGLATNIVLLALAAFVAYGRTKLAPILPRS